MKSSNSDYSREIPWVIEEPTKIKHQLLEKYISPWMSILYSQQRRLGIKERLIYFDGFAGPGIYWRNEFRKSKCFGSPLIVARTAKKFVKENRNRRFDIICIDEDDKCINILNEYLDKVNYRCNQSWKAYKKDFNTAINRLFDQFEDGEDIPPTFIFIDPFGYSGFPISTLRRIMKIPLTELFINFMIYDINRFFKEPIFEKHMQDLFGCSDFKKAVLLENTEERYNFFKNLYCSQLFRYAGAKYVMPFRVNCHDQQDRPRYYLIHASNNFKALRTMKDAMANTSQLKYGFEAVGIVQTQTNLFEDPEKANLRMQILDYIKSNKSNFTDYQALEEWAYKNTCGVAKTIKAEILYLEETKAIEIKRMPRQRKSAVTKGAKIVYIGS